MNGEDTMAVECSRCGYVFQSDELEQNPRELKPCPNCGALRRHAHLTHKESLNLNEDTGLKAKRQDSIHKNNRVDYELREGHKIGGDGRPVYRKSVKDREHADSDNSYQELVIDTETDKVMVDKHEKLSEHKEASKNQKK